MLQALNLRIHNNLSYGAIAKIMNYDKALIVRKIKAFENILEDPDVLTQYDIPDMRTKLLKSAELKLLSKITEKQALKNASVNNAAYAFSTVHNARRLEEGLSTGNIAINITEQERSGLEAIARQAAIEYVSKVGENTDNEAVNEPDNAG